MRGLIIAILLVAAAFTTGFYYSTQIHGDWILVRNGTSGCAAIDPDARREVGTWAMSADGRCHMSRFIWSHLAL